MSKLYPYQQEGVDLIEHYEGRVLLADEQGLGKTIQALKYLQQHPELRPAVIVCPASVKYVWESQAAEHCHLRTVTCHSQRPPRRTLLKERGIFIINYDILVYWALYFIPLQPKALLLDEAHFLKNRESQRTKAVRRLCERAKIPHVMGLSGTPLTNRPEELWSILHLIWPDIFDTFWQYAQEYCEPEMTPYGQWRFKGAANLDKLHRILKRLGMIRRRKKDVLKDLPIKSRFVVPLDINNRKEYQEAHQDFLLWLKRRDAGQARRASRAKGLAKASYMKRLAAVGKLAAVMEWIDSFLESSDDKLLIGAIHHKVIDTLHERYRKQSVTFTGNTPVTKRRQVMLDFRNNPRTRILIGQIKAIGTGVDGLQHVSHTSAVVELPWDPGTLSQFDDRIHRIGQKQKVSIYYLVAKNTVEESICRIIQTKQEVLTRALDGGTNLKAMSIDIYDKLEQELRKGKT